MHVPLYQALPADELGAASSRASTMRQCYAAEAVENAVVAGVTLHGDEFALTVEPADDSVLPGSDAR